MVFEMTRREITTEEILNNPSKYDHYWSILNLTTSFKILEQKHYKYALMINGTINAKQSTKEFFLDENNNDQLQPLYDSGLIKCCIKKGNVLSNYLRELVSKYYLLEIDNPGGKVKKYRLSKSFIGEAFLLKVLFDINNWGVIRSYH
jgi:hypothetical protein